MRTLTVSTSTDEWGFPIVSWQEPRAAPGLFWRKSYWRYAKVFLSVHMEEVHFVQRMDKAFGVQEHLVGVPFDSVTGFSIHAAQELYRDSDTPLPENRPGRDQFRDDLVLIAELSRPSRGGTMFLPLTMTSASHAEVTNLHGLLTQAFVANRQAITERISVRQKQLKDQDRAEWDKRHLDNYLYPPVNSGSQRFVRLVHMAEKHKDPKGFYRKSGLTPAATDAVPTAQVIPQKGGGFFASVKSITSRADGEQVYESWGSVSTLSIKSAVDHSEIARLLTVTLKRLDGTWEANSKLEDLEMFTVFYGDELALPSSHLLADDADAQASIMVVVAYFKDGEFMPICYGDLTHEKELDAVCDLLTETFLGGGMSGATSAAGTTRRPRL